MIKQMGRALSRTRARSRSMSMTRSASRSHVTEEPRSRRREPPAKVPSKEQESLRLTNESDDELSLEDFTLSGTGFDFDFSEDGLIASPRRPEQSKKLSNHLHTQTRSVSPMMSSFASNSQSLLGSEIEAKKETEDRRGRVRRTKSNTSQSFKSVRSTGSTRSIDSNEDDKRRRRSTNRSRSRPREKKDNNNSDAQVNSKSTRSRSKTRDADGQKISRDMSQSRDSSEVQSNGKKRKSKMEKILQLQEKNQRYKEEFRKVQKDRKALKKEIEVRMEEAACLAKEIDLHISETTILKQKLSDALHQVEIAKSRKSDDAKYDDDGDNNNVEIERLNKQISDLLEQKSRDDEFMNEIKDQIKFQMELVEGLQDENEKLRVQNETLSSSEKDFNQMNAEIDRLKSELDITVQHATDMVKEREDAIADLLKENDEMKRMVAIRGQVASDDSSEALIQLKQELAIAAAALEESQDRNVALEEEIESLVQKNDDIDAEQLRLRDELEGWQEKASAAQQTVTLIEGNARNAQRRASELEQKLAELEKRYKDEQTEIELQHKTALEAIEKAAFEKAMAIAETKAKAPPNPQEMMLQAAVANQQRKQAEAARSSWIGGFRLGGTLTESDENVSAEQKRIKDLEASNAEQDEDIKKLKSELVRLRSTFNDTNYKNKKTIEHLSSENQAFRLKIQALEQELGLPSSLETAFPELLPSSSNSSSV